MLRQIKGETVFAELLVRTLRTPRGYRHPPCPRPASHEGKARRERKFFGRRSCENARGQAAACPDRPGRSRQMTSSISARSSIERANGPRWSSVRDSGRTPARDTSPCVGFMRKDAAERRRADDRAVGLRADRERHHAGGDRRRRARRRAAGRALDDRADCASCRDGNRRIRW